MSKTQTFEELDKLAEGLRGLDTEKLHDTPEHKKWKAAINTLPKEDRQKYYDKKFEATESRCSTHPHQFHLEILSELGVFGYFLFVIFFIYFLTRGIINYKQNKNILHLGSLIFVFVSIFLPIPTGSFFTTYGATIFWINFSLVLIFEKELTK